MKNLSRFNYWDFSAINPRVMDLGRAPDPALVVVATSLGDYFRSRYTAGDDEAIFEFAAQDKAALRSRWVVVVLEAWQREGSAANREKVMRFVEHFLKPAPAERLSLLSIISNDQAAFQDLATLHHLLGMPLSEAASLAAQRRGWLQGMASEVYRHYREAVELFFQPSPEGQYPWEEVFNWLNLCRENLQKLL